MDRLTNRTFRLAARVARRSALAGVASLALAGPVGAEDAPLTYAGAIEPIVREHCVSCHRPGDVAPMSFLTYDEVRPWAKSIRKTVASREMPPFHAEKGDYPIKNDLSLPAEKIEKILAWVDGGAPAGDLSTVPPPPAPAVDGWIVGKPDHVVDIGADWVVRADVKDEYRCYVLDPGIEQDAWIQGVEYRPGNRQVVHHIMAYAEPTGSARLKDEADPDPGFLCGMTGDQGSQRLDLLLGGWAPGTPPNMFPTGVARKFPAGADIVYQVHYHNETGMDQPDRSAMGFHFATETVRAEGKIQVIGAFQLDIAAGDANSTSFARWRAPWDLDLYSTMPHMHYIGKAMKVVAFFPDGTTKTLIDVPRFDFNWQMVYAYEQPIRLPKGTKLEMTAVHDNSAENPRNPFSPPIPMKWGEATDEEMAHCWLNVVRSGQDLNVVPAPPVIGAEKSAGAGGM